MSQTRRQCFVAAPFKHQPRHSTGALRASAGLGALLLSASAWAQTELAPVVVTAPQQRGTDSMGLQQVISSGSRLGLSALETPASVYAITREQMRERGLRSTEQALDAAPGVDSGQCFGFTCVSLRGFSHIVGITYSFDGNRYQNTTMTPRGTFVFDRIELLKGPASVLHGLGSVGGGVNFVSKRADGREERELLVALDSDGKKELGFGIGGRLQEGVNFRFDANLIDSVSGSSGWVERTGYRYVHLAGEIAVNISPRERLSFSAQVFDDDAQWYYGTPLANGRIDRRLRHRNFNTFDSHMHKSVAWARVKYENNLSNGLLFTNEFYANEEHRSWKNAESYNLNPLTDRVAVDRWIRIMHNQYVIGNRSELSGSTQWFGAGVDWMVGADISRFNHWSANNTPMRSRRVEVDALAGTPPLFTDVVPHISPFLPTWLTDIDTVAAYSEARFTINPQWSAIAGLRHERVSVSRLYRLEPGRLDRSWNSDSYRLGFVYQLNPGTSFYAQWSHSYEPASSLPFTRQAASRFELGNSTQFEFGVKAEAGARLPSGESRFQYTVSVFDIERRNITTRNPLNPDATIQIGSQLSTGVEFSALWNVSSELSVGFNGSVLDARFGSFFEPVPGGVASRAGLNPTNVPEEVYNFFLTYSPSSSVQYTASLRSVGGRWANNANTVFFPSYRVVDLGASFEVLGGTLRLQLRNAFDELYISRGVDFNANQGLLGRPRSVEVSYSMNF